MTENINTNIFDKYNLAPLDRKGKIFVDGIEERMSYSLEFIKSQYPNFEKLNLTIEFIEYHHSDAVNADFEDLVRVGYFPSTEAEMELDHSIKHALIGSYKAAFADLRRAIELTLTSIYLTSEHTDKQEAVNWVTSQANTPFVSDMLKKLARSGRYKNINDNYKWSDNLKQFYWNISDFAHNKGELKSYRHLNETNFFMSGTSAPRVNLQTLYIFCDAFIACVEEIVVMLSLYNPVILVGLPMFEKFGTNPPMSGFYEEHQAEIVNQIIPIKYKVFFENLKQTDEEIKGIVDWVASHPDLTKEQIEEQLKRDK
ncbi:MAG: hypothetical protein HY738_08500 [Bacteroidia bacterium]|nr:hypothetical protein [Bacteroidia bacterium]